MERMPNQDSSTTANDATNNATPNSAVDDDEPDDWDKRIYSTGCYSKSFTHTHTRAHSQHVFQDIPGAVAWCHQLTLATVDENMKLTDCYYDTKDWRACKDEMKVFKECWKRHGNTQRTATKDQSIVTK